MAGHSHWAKIKRAKGATDAKRGKVWSKISRKIIIAAKNGGDPRDNLSLRYTIDEAKAANMPKDTIEKAIKKGTGELGGENYETVTYEAYAPGGVALLIDGLTNNRARTAPEIRSAPGEGRRQPRHQRGGRVPVHQAGGHHRQGRGGEGGRPDRGRPGGRRRRRAQRRRSLRGDHLADRVHEGEGRPGGGQGPVEAGEITNLPNSTVPVDAEAAQKLLKLIDTLEDNDDVQSVSHNAEIPESVSV